MLGTLLNIMSTTIMARSQHYFKDKPGEFVTPRLGSYARMERCFDKQDRPIAIEFWDERNRECCGPDGMLKLITNYLKDNRVEEEAHYPSGGTFPPIVVRTYDGPAENEERTLTGESYRDSEDAAFAVGWGYSGWSAAFDDVQRPAYVNFTLAMPSSCRRFYRVANRLPP